MSLWSKATSEISFDDIDTFCREGTPEGVRLDYKVDIPNDLAKTIAAFANTIGGLILLGVDADQTTNTPIWPPTRGMQFRKGISETIGNIARDAVHPSVPIEISSIIDNSHRPGEALVVVRVPESRYAPHAVEGRKKVFVASRTRDTTRIIDLADIDRIEQMLARRRVLAERREEELQNNLRRSRGIIFSAADLPVRWLSVSPVYPWNEIRSPIECLKFHRSFEFSPWENVRWRYQSFVGGSLAIGRIGGFTSPPLNGCLSSVSSNGTMFVRTLIEEYSTTTRSYAKDLHHALNLVPRERIIWLSRFQDLAREWLGGFVRCYERSEWFPTEVAISVGIEHAHGLMMFNQEKNKVSNSQFPDDEFRVDRIVSTASLRENPAAGMSELFDEIAFSFDCHHES